MFESVEKLKSTLGERGYIADTSIATAVFLANALDKPLLLEGPAGVGKTELAKTVAAASGRNLIRLQCYEGLDEARALYEWNYRKQLLRIQAESGSGWDELETSIFGEGFLLERPLLAAIRSEDPSVLLVDEIDRTEFEFEAFLLELLAEKQITIPELGTIVAKHPPLVFLTSNATRDLSDALKRRCLYLHIDYPTPELERQIVTARIPEIDEALAKRLTEVVAAVRELELRKPPSVSETLDWARTILTLGLETIDDETLATTLNVLLKHRADIATALARLTHR